MVLRGDRNAGRVQLQALCKRLECRDLFVEDAKLVWGEKGAQLRQERHVAEFGKTQRFELIESRPLQAGKNSYCPPDLVICNLFAEPPDTFLAVAGPHISQ